MKSKFLNTLVPALFILAVGTAQAKDSDLLSLSVEHFKDTATVTDTAPDGVTISTENGYKEHRGPLRTVWNDEFLEGIIDKKTGQKSFLVSVWITYTGNSRSYTTASYLAPQGPRSVPATLTRLNKSYCAVGDCTNTEYLTFPVDETMLRQLAAEPAAGKHVLWPFKLVAKSGPGYSGGFSSAEIAGLLAKVDDYRPGVAATAAAAATSVVAPTAVAAATLAATTSLTRDFGVGGMAVAATADQPDRAGVLIIAVTGGSVAHKAGIIVGDILYEFNGHPVRTPAELQAAVAACAANTVAAIKLFRGTNATAVTARF
jgi:PDZ domain